MSLKDEFLGIKEQKAYKSKDIYERLQDFEDDTTRRCFKTTYGNLLTEDLTDLIPSELKRERDSSIIILMERKEKKLPTSDPNKTILQYLNKTMRRSISVDSVPSKLFLNSVQTMLLAAYVSTDLTSKQSILNKVKSIIGLSTTIKEQEEARDIDKRLFGTTDTLTERLEITVPDKFTGEEVAIAIVKRLNQISGLETKEEYKQMELLFKKINSSIESRDEIFTDSDFDILVHYQLDIGSRLSALDEY